LAKNFIICQLVQGDIGFEIAIMRQQRKHRTSVFEKTVDINGNAETPYIASSPDFHYWRGTRDDVLNFSEIG